MFKFLAVAAPIALGGFYVTGGFSSEWSRDIGRPAPEVLAALEDLDIGEQPGSPGTDPARSGGITPMFRMEKTATGIRWFVMSGEKVATVMTAELRPLADGAGTRVTAHVERGDAPDDFVSPAFRSEGVTLALFQAALEGELNEMVRPAAGDRRTCLELRNRFLGGQLPGLSGPGQERRDLKEAVGGTAKTIMGLHAFQGEWRRLGCEAFEKENLEETAFPESGTADDRTAASGTTSTMSEPSTDRSINFKPGEPMLDPTPTVRP